MRCIAGYTPTRTYVEASKEEILYPMIEENSVLLVPGAYFGDEGKGKTVAAIAEHPAVQVVARVNSGENAGEKTCCQPCCQPQPATHHRASYSSNPYVAGHTVYGLTPAGIMTQFAFNLCPSGLLTPGKVNVVGPVHKKPDGLEQMSCAWFQRLICVRASLICSWHSTFAP